MAKSQDPSIKAGASNTRTTPFKESGVPGTPIYAGYPQDNETNAKLRGSEKYRYFSEALVNVAIVGAGVRYFLNLVAKATWAVTPADDSPAAQEYADFVKDVMDDIDTPWRRIVRRAAMYRFYGFSIQEWTAKRRPDGRIGFRDIAPRPQSTITKWDTDRGGNILGVIQSSPQDGTEIWLPRKKIMYLVDDSLSDSPEGLGLVRHIYPYAERLKVYEKLEQDGFESDLRGIPIGRAPQAALAQMVEEGKITKEQKDQWEAYFTDFIVNHIRKPNTGLLLDSITYQTQDEAGRPSNVPMWDLELLKGNSSALSELASAIQRTTRSIAILLGVEQLLLGENAVGSYALARDKTNVFFLIADSTLAELSDAFKKDFVQALWDLNGFPEEMKPKMTPESIRFRDVEQVTKALKDLAQSGAKIDIADPAVNEIRELLGLSHVPEELIAELQARAEAARKALEEGMNNQGEGDNPPPDEENADGSGSGNE